MDICWTNALKNIFHGQVSEFLGLDVHIAGCKAVGFNLEGKILAYACREYIVLHPQPGWTELDVNQVWSKVVECIKEVGQHSFREEKL